MSVGDLSPDQARFVATVAGRTGLDESVVRAWVGAESGWNVTKAGHNYLNIGPGRQYTSVDQAAAATAGLILGSQHYTGILAAIPAGAAAQVKAIGESAWGTVGGLLSNVWRQISGNPGLSSIPNPADAAGAAAGAIGDLLGVDKIAAEVMVVGLQLVFVAAAFGLIAMGLHRLTEKPAKDLLGEVGQVVGLATGTKGMAAAAGAVA